MRKGISCLIFIFVPVLLSPENVWGQTQYGNQNLALKYRTESGIPMHYQVSKTGNIFSILFSIELPPDADFNGQYELSYEIKSEYGSSSSLMTRTLNFARSGIGEEGAIKYFRITIDDAENFKILLLKLKNTLSTVEHVWDIPLKEPITYEPPDFYLSRSEVDLPYLYPYIERGDALRIESPDSAANTFFIYRYDHTFSPADPPMYRLEKDVSRSMQVDTIFTVNSGEPFNLTKQGLYFIQSDTAKFSGINIRAEEKFYPKLIRMEDVIAPVIYLTTSQEIENLKNNADPKTAFEKFWLNISVS
ncbi:MAG: hypothetical protein KFF73_17950, partial [Cyclobacteriaceae bacterium]|nr:hypothetical protein [Cyclobacteriaceae bacterium]